MKYCFDLDNTLCETIGREYEKSTPIHHRISKVNRLFDEGHYVFIYTARGMGFFDEDLEKIEREYREMTEKHLKNWGVKYHKLMFGKPGYDVIVDDKNQTLEEFDLLSDPIRGFIAGSFDVIHPGYIEMLKEAKRHCTHLTIALHHDPTVERPDKIAPILDVTDRKIILESIRFVDEVITYKTEADLINLLDNLEIGIRFLGDDYLQKDFTKGRKRIPIWYLSRDHGWSTTKFKNLIANQFA